ncbi:MAG: polyamine aminopropyltransferase [Nitrososphaerota archaeon]|nr:polyamine aminopropyltransferase [Candidatus Calditenuis fumarioli]
MTEYLWISENVAEGLREYYAVREVLVRTRTRYQDVSVVDTVPFGRCLVIDGKLQSSLLDEHVYHEVLVHPAMVTHGSPRRVLVIGGGEGATAREVLRWRTVEELTMVEIDEEVVSFCRKHMPELSAGAFDDRRMRLVFAEGRSYLEKAPDGSFDVIVVDATDPTEGAASLPLYSQEFYRMASEKLRDGGVLVTQATSIVHNPFAFRSIMETVRTAFSHVTPLAVFVVSFSSVWGFVVASDSRSPEEVSGEEVDRVLRERVSGGLRFYSGRVHHALIELARRYLELSRPDYRIIRDGEPVLIP